MTGTNEKRKRWRSWWTLPLVFAAMTGCAAEVGDGEVAGDGEELLFMAEAYDPSDVCDFRMVAEAGSGTLEFPYCATADVTPGGWGPYPPFDDVRTLIFAQHGRGSDAQMYLDYANQAVTAAHSAHFVESGETFVIAPQFVEPSELDEVYDWYWDDLFVWNEYGADHDWALGGTSSWPGAPGSRSSFSILEELLTRAIQRMPNLEEIVFVGQSAGGQFTQRYALLNDYDFPEGVHVRYVPTNGWAYAYPSDERRDYLFGGFEEPNMALSFKYFPDTEVCSPTASWSSCDYDTYELGLGRVPATHWAASVLPTFGPAGSDPDWVENVDILSVGLRYRSRDVTYLAAEADVVHAEQCHCGMQMQGENRRQRAQNLSDYMKTLWNAPTHDVMPVPDQGHGGQSFREPCGVAAIFGHPEHCQPLTERTVGSGWSGDIVSIAYGNVDDDPADEVAIVRNQGLGGQVLVLDDRAHRHAVLFEPSAGWGFLQIPREVAFGDTNGDGLDELGVVRSTSSGDSWFVYRRNDGGSWSTVGHGGADWPSPRSAYHIAFGDIDGDGTDDELIVARNATSGPRWYYYGVHSNALYTERSAGQYWGDGIFITDIACGDTDGDGQAEVGISTNATTGARVQVHHMNGYYVQSVDTIGTGWRTNHVVRHLTFGNMDDDDGEEMFIGRSVYPGYDRWVVMNDATQGYAVVAGGGRNGDPGWPSDASITDVDFGFLDAWHHYPALAVSALSDSGPVLEIVTMQVRDDVLKVGDYSRPEVAANVDVRSVAFGDIDGLGGDEIAYGVDDAQDVGFGVRALPAP